MEPGGALEMTTRRDVLLECRERYTRLNIAGKSIFYLLLPNDTGATFAKLEQMRERLRGLVSLIEKRRQPSVLTNFADEIGEGELVELARLSPGVDLDKFRAKAFSFLRKHESDQAIHKLRWNEPLTPEDLDALEAIFVSEGASTAEIDAAGEQGGLGLFVRSLVGLDREAAKRAFSTFAAGRMLTGNQIQFVDLTVDHLTQRGWMDPSQLYKSPFTDRHPAAPENLFDDALASELVALLASVRQNAVPVGVRT